jgi:hypothetical protein
MLREQNRGVAGVDRVTLFFFPTGIVLSRHITQVSQTNGSTQPEYCYQEIEMTMLIGSVYMYV